MPARSSRLGPRGRRLWTALHRDVKHDPATDLLVEEACRIADRLERLDELLRGDVDAWARVTLPDDGSELVLKVTPLLSEARQQATALQRLVASLQTKAEPVSKDGDALDALVRSRAAATPGQ